MKRKLVIIDTSMLVVWLRVPGMERCDSDDLGFDEVDLWLKQTIAAGAKLVLPLAVLIEAGNHISQLSNQKRETAQRFIRVIREAVEGNSPWIIFNQQIRIFDDEGINSLISEWFDNIDALSIGDITVKRIADFYVNDTTDVMIYTCDHRLRAYSPVSEVPVPRRRR